MPTFCRHNRLVENCPICSKSSRVASSPASRIERRPSRADSAGGRARAPRKSASGGMTVRRMARAADDGYEHDLVPGLRSSEDAGRLADELAFGAARVRELSSAPQGLYAEIAAAEDREEAAWLTFLVAFLSPLAGEDPFSAISAVRTSWASGEVPSLEDVEVGPRSAFEPRRGSAALVAYRTWAERLGGQIPALAGEESWTLQHRYDRAFERLGFPGFGRPQRVEFLVLAHHLGLVELDPWTLHLSAATPTDPVGLAAKRILGIGDPVLLQRRQRELASGAGVPVEALELALYNWASGGERYAAGSSAVVDAEERERIARALGL